MSVDDIKVVNTEGKIVEPAVSTEHSVEGSVMSSTAQLEQTVLKVLGMENTSSTVAYSDEISSIIDYAKAQSKEPLTPDRLAWIVRELDMTIGSSPFAEKRIYRVARFTTLNKQKADIEKELNSFRNY